MEALTPEVLAAAPVPEHVFVCMQLNFAQGIKSIIGLKISAFKLWGRVKIANSEYYYEACTYHCEICYC
jgi:hypothetical protein